MDWTAPVSAVSGGLVAVISTYLADRTRWRREERARTRERRQALYADFLTALFGAREQIFAASRWPRRLSERKALAGAAIREHEVYARRYQMELVASQHVRECTQAALTTLLEYRDEVASGTRWNDPQCTARRERFRACQQRLLQAMRTDLAAGQDDDQSRP
ncbi:hypothetical protein Q3V23_00065 [Streptomyces sp. VNUA116]|uniref:hypothetical protein n=1 Tax=Streptomyces sp. VNUA116 TaxID=3062449 RepID=UPI0026765234|nr:hypothetical protein [Streptomyces sp. VNUA116]WKU42596.1 hypothetical protein Q3V23_00065 [Streptomyces sp. VNUA116]